VSATTAVEPSSSGGDTMEAECEPADGKANLACEDPSRPYCGLDGGCVGCDAIDCAAVAPGASVCADDGRCVACTAEVAGDCGGVTPICDVEAGTCVGCVEHGQCASGACDYASGACFTETLYVDRAAPCALADGSPEAPFCEIGDAVAKVNKLTPTVVRVKASASVYLNPVIVGINVKVAILRDGAGTVRLEVDGADSLLVNTGAAVYLQDLQISKGSLQAGLKCDGGEVWIERSRVVDRKGLAIDGVNCKIILRRSRISSNLAGGIKLNGGSLGLINSYIVTNGGAFSAVAGVTLTNKATLEAVYATIVDNDGTAGVEDSLECTGHGAVTLRNSILFGRTAASSVDCPGATASYSVVDAPSLQGVGNKVVPAIDGDWFVAPQLGDFAIHPDTPFKDVAVWKTGDPLTDYDGTARPGVDGALDYAGADRPN